MDSSKSQIYTKTSLLSVSPPSQGRSTALHIYREIWQRKTVEFQIKTVSNLYMVNSSYS